MPFAVKFVYYTHPCQHNACGTWAGVKFHEACEPMRLQATPTVPFADPA